MAEYERVGLAAARIEDIVAAAGVSWGSFYRYFPRKEDVLLEAGAALCRAFAAAAAEGMAAGRPTAESIEMAFQALQTVGPQNVTLRVALFDEVVTHPGRLSAYVDEDVVTFVDAATAILAEGQRRGDVRDDEPARSLAIVLVHAVVSSAWREAVLGRPAHPTGQPATPLSGLALQTVLRGIRPQGA